jgi:preprotein translocase subunit SecE
VARSARQQRRQRRAAQLEPAAAGAGAPPAPPARPVRAGGDEPERRRAEPSVRGEPTRRFRFIRESWGELNKVDWPGRNQVTQGTIVVIIACAIVGAYLWALDLGIKQVVENVILRGT